MKCHKEKVVILCNIVLIFAEGKIMAVRYGSKYTETSVTLNDCIDQLLVGIVRQIRLTKELEGNPKKKPEMRSRAASLQVSE